MELREEQRELFKLLRNKGIEKQTAIMCVVIVEDSKEPYNLIIDWIKNNSNATAEETLFKLYELY